MRLPAAPYGVTSVAGLIDWLRTLVSSIAAGWSVEHAASGRHAWSGTRMIPFAPGRFTASGAMVWGVDAADVTEYGYRVLGNLLALTFRVAGTDITGTPSNILQIALPDGFRADGSWVGTLRYSDAGTNGVGSCVVSHGGRVVSLLKPDVSNWTGTTSDNTTVAGSIVMCIQRDDV